MLSIYSYTVIIQYNCIMSRVRKRKERYTNEWDGEQYVQGHGQLRMDRHG
jgi:hypothetical protein